MRRAHNVPPTFVVGRCPHLRHGARHIDPRIASKVRGAIVAAVKRWTIRVLALAGALIPGCGDDDPEPYGHTGGGTSGEVPVEPTTSMPHESTCTQMADCDDANVCTADACSAGACVHTPVGTQACRPSIEIEEPPRAATLRSEAPAVAVRGRVVSPAGDVARLQVAGALVEVAPDGTFAHVIEAAPGGNTLVVEVTDALGQTRKRVQSFLWSTGYHLPTVHPEGLVEEGIAFYLDQESIDDGEREPPVDDLGTLFHRSIEAVDLQQSVMQGLPLTSVAGYDLSLTSLGRQGVETRVTAIDGGLALEAAWLDLEGTFLVACNHDACELTGGDADGTISIGEVRIVAQAQLTVDDAHRLDAVLTQVDTTVDEIHLQLGHPWADSLLAAIQPVLESVLAPALEAELEAQAREALTAALSARFAGFGGQTVLSFPSPADPARDIAMTFETDFAAVDVHDGQWPPRPSPAQGAAFFLRAGFFSPTPVTAGHLGIPDRAGCGLGPLPLDLPREGAVEIALTDDLLNQLLHALWREGMFTFPVSVSDPTGELRAQITGKLAPTLSDCNPEGELRMHLGDLQLETTLDLLGNTVAFGAFTSLAVAVVPTLAPEGVALELGEVRSIETEIVSVADDLIELEPLLERSVEQQLERTLLDALSGSAVVPLALRSGDLALELEAATHRDGVTLLSGAFTAP